MFLRKQPKLNLRSKAVLPQSALSSRVGSGQTTALSARLVWPQSQQGTEWALSSFLPELLCTSKTCTGKVLPCCGIVAFKLLFSVIVVTLTSAVPAVVFGVYWYIFPDIRIGRWVCYGY